MAQSSGSKRSGARTSRRRSCLWRLAVWTIQLMLLLAIGCVALLVGWVHSSDFQRRAKAIAESQIEAQTGEALTLTEVRVQFLPPGLEVDGVHLFHRQTGETIASVERLRLPLVLSGGGPAIGRLELQSPLIQLHIDKEGKLTAFHNAKRRGPNDPPPKPLERLPFHSLDIRDGTIRVFFPDGMAELTHIQSVPEDGPIHDVRADLRVQFKDFDESSALHFPAVVVGPDQVFVPDLRVDLPTLALAGSAHIPLQGELDIALSGGVQLDALNDALVEPRKAHGLVDLDLEVTGRPDNPTLAVNAWGTHLGVDLPGVFTPLLTYELGNISVAALATRDRIEVEDLTLYWGGGHIRAAGLIDPETKTLLDARVVGDSVSLRRMLMAFDAAPNPWIDLIADAEVRASGTLDPLLLKGDFDFAVADLRVQSSPIHLPGREMLNIPSAWARGQLTLDKTHIKLVAGEIAGPRTQASAVVDIGFGPRGPLDIQADIHHADLSDFQPLGGVELSGVGRVTGRIAGPFNKLTFQGDGDIEGFSVLGIPFADRLITADFNSPDMKSLKLGSAIASVGESTYGGDFVFDFKPPMSMHTDVSMQGGRIEDIVGVFIDLPGLTGNMSGDLSLHGPIFDMDGGGNFVFSDIEMYGEHFETGVGNGYLDQGEFTLDDLRMLRVGNREGVILRGSVGREWALDMDLIADGFKLETLDTLRTFEQPVSGNLGASMRIGNTLFDPNPRGQLFATDVRWAGNFIEDSVVNFETSAGVLAFSGNLAGKAVHTEGTLGLWGEQPYSASLDLKRFPAHLFYPVAADGNPVSAVASGEVAVSGSFGDAWSPVGISSTLDDVEVRWSSHVLRNRSPWKYLQDGTRFTLDNFDLHGGRSDFAVRATGGDGLEVDGRGQVDIDLLRALVPGLERAEGQAEVDLKAIGRAPNVETRINVDVQADLLRYSAVPVAFEDLEATLVLTDDVFTVTHVEGGIGGGRIAGTGRIDAESWVPTRYDLDAEIRDAQVQWVDTLPPAIGDADLAFDGPVGALLLGGEVQVDDMLFSDRIDWEDWVVEYRNEVLVDPSSTIDEEPWFNFNVHVAADQTIRLQNNVAEGTASADLRIIGDTARPGLVGWARVDDGIAFLQDREFRVDRGELTYNDPWSWDPDIDFDLITDIESRSQRYRVNYQIFGPFSDWRTATRSDPGLPQADVNALLWFGVTTDELEQSGELPAAVAQGVADLLLTDLFASTQASELGEVPDLLFDRIDVATGVNGRGEYSAEPRLVVEKRLTDLGSLDLTWEFNLGRPEDNYLRVDKRVGGIWSIAGWYATLQRDRVLPIGGAYGVDVSARWESN